MRLGMFGLVLLLAGCAEADRSPKGVGFGSYATPQTNDTVLAGNQAVQRPVAASPSTQQGTGIAAGGLPASRYTGRKANTMHFRSAAEVASKFNDGFTRAGTYKIAMIAGHKMQAQQVYVGSHHFVVLRAGTTSQFLFGIGRSKKALKTIMSDVANLTGCSANRGVFSGPTAFVVPINCL